MSSVKAFNSDAADADVTGGHSMLLPCQHLYAPHCPAALLMFNALCIDEVLEKLFKRPEHGDDELLDSCDSDRLSEDDAEPLLDIPDAHLSAKSTKNIFSVRPKLPFFPTLSS